MKRSNRFGLLSIGFAAAAVAVQGLTLILLAMGGCRAGGTQDLSARASSLDRPVWYLVIVATSGILAAGLPVAGFVSGLRWIREDRRLLAWVGILANVMPLSLVLWFGWKVLSL